jgi:hypothetical protein
MYGRVNLLKDLAYSKSLNCKKMSKKELSKVLSCSYIWPQKYENKYKKKRCETDILSDFTKILLASFLKNIAG